MILSPKLISFVLIPLVINILVFISIFYHASESISLWIAMLTDWMPEWLKVLQYVLWLLFFLALTGIILFTFTIAGNIIAAPFNTLLAEKIQRMEGTELPNLRLSDWLAVIPKSIGRELRKLFYYLPRVILLLMLTVIPILGLVLWFLFNSWMMAVQYCDYAADNRMLSFSQTLSQLKRYRSKSLSFGIIVNLAMLIPLMNLLIIPASVAGATLLWEREIKQE